MHILTISIFLIFLFFHLNFTGQATTTTNTHIYMPIHSLRKSDICSIISIALASTKDNYWEIRVDSHHSRRTMLYILLSIKSAPNNQHVLDFIHECYPKFNWSIVEKNYLHLKTRIEPYQVQYHAGKLGNYWQLKIPIEFSGPLNSREYISRYRSNGFQPNELKIYWNYNEIQALADCNHYNPITDKDARNALLTSPVHQRKHSGKIQFILSGIQDAVFTVPDDKQVIVLDFADERMPGGYFLEYAMTQEEVRMNIPFEFFFHSSGLGYSL